MSELVGSDYLALRYRCLNIYEKYDLQKMVLFSFSFFGYLYSET